MTSNVVLLPEPADMGWDAIVGRRVRGMLYGRATQAQLGAMLGLGQSDVSKRLNGRVPWKGEELAIVARALGVSVAVLYGETPSPTGDGVSDRYTPRDSNPEPID